jgi:hypothetical protein
MLLPFIIKASSEEGILVLAKKHAEGWIDSHGGAWTARADLDVVPMPGGQGAMVRDDQ